MSIVINGYNLSPSDKSIVVSSINYRKATNFIESDRLSRLVGTKLTNTQLDSKTIDLSGYLFADTADEFNTLVETFIQKTVVKQKNLVINGNRTYLVTTRQVDIPDRSYTQTYASFSLSFLVSRGYGTASLVSEQFTLTSGADTINISPTISGTLPNRPTLIIDVGGQGGYSPSNSFTITDNDTGFFVTISGLFTRGSSINLNYDNFTITNSGATLDYSGFMNELEVGTRNLTVTISGSLPSEGHVLKNEYRPRYY